MTLSAVLLAGGESRRMGQDKATLEFAGEALWQRQLRILRAVPVEKTMVSARSKCDWRPRDVELVLDQAPSRGPLSGIAAGIAGMHTTHLLALAVDMPFMTSAVLEKLWRAAAPGIGIVPTIGDRAEPLAAIYPREAGAEFAAALNGTDWSLQRVVRQLAGSAKVKLLDCTQEASLFRSVNEPGDVVR